MPTIKRYRTLPGLNPTSLADSIVNSVDASDNLVARGWRPNSEVFAQWGECIGEGTDLVPHFGIGAALVLQAYTNDSPAGPAHMLAHRLFTPWNADSFAFAHYRPGDPDRISAHTVGIQTLAIQGSNNLQLVFDVGNDFWPHYNPRKPIQGWSADPTPTPACDAWSDRVISRWRDYQGFDPILYFDNFTWKDSRGAILKRARTVRQWEESKGVVRDLAAAHAEAHRIHRARERKRRAL